MEAGYKNNEGLGLYTNSFSYDECLFLKKALDYNFSLNVTVQPLNKNQYVIFVHKESMPYLRKLVFFLIIPEMRYKIL
jgi:hypothetical protein